RRVSAELLAICGGADDSRDGGAVVWFFFVYLYQDREKRLTTGGTEAHRAHPGISLVFPCAPCGQGLANKMPQELNYWLTTVQMPASLAQPLPESADVAIIGAGFTGLSAALSLAKRGAKVVVL